MQNLTPKIQIFILCVVLIIANNIDQNLKVEKTTNVKLRLEKCNQTKSDNSENLLGQNMEGYKSIFYFISIMSGLDITTQGVGIEMTSGIGI
jgi:hypothetical protein